MLKHGYYGTPTYKSWSEMKYRCNKVGKKYWHDKGIKYCDKWEFFENFLEDMGKRPLGTSLDRIDGSGNYCKNNCRWATDKMQQNNMVNNRRFKYMNKNMTLTEWAKLLNKKRSTLAQRFYVYGWSVDKTLLR